MSSLVRLFKWVKIDWGHGDPSTYWHIDRSLPPHQIVLLDIFQMNLITENNDSDYSSHCVSCAVTICPNFLWMAKYRVCEFDPYVTSILLALGSSTIVYWTRSGIQLSDVNKTNFDWIMFGDRNKPGSWYYMHREKPHKAFLVHESCWSLLVQQFEGEEIDLNRLFEVCKEIPLPGRREYRSKWAWQYRCRLL